MESCRWRYLPLAISAKQSVSSIAGHCIPYTLKPKALGPVTSIRSLCCACRHQDGVWRSAGKVPRSETGRPLAHIAVNGHGSYPIAGTIPRIFFAANDHTSNQGAVWDTVRFVLKM